MKPLAKSATTGVRSRILGIAPVACLMLAGCTAGSPASLGIVQIRNATGSPIAVHVGDTVLGARTHGAPPWQPGACSLEFGIDPGNVSIAVSGPSIQGNPSYQAIVLATTPSWITVVVQADGTVTFGTGQIAQGPCAASHEVAPPPGY